MQLDSTNSWLDGVRRFISPNCDDRPDNITLDMIVIHGISLPPGEFGGPYIDQFFSNTLDPDHHPYFQAIIDLRVSAHVLVGRGGELTQYVSFRQRAWHAGESVFDGRDNCNDFSIGIELEGCDDVPYAPAQYQVLAELTKLLIRSWSGIKPERIVGHCDIASDRKTDPGPSFDWDHYRSLITPRA